MRTSKVLLYWPSYVLGVIGLVIIVSAGYIALNVWSVGWYNHDNSIKITMPDGTVYQYKLENK